MTLNLSPEEIQTELMARLHDLGVYATDAPMSSSRYIRFADKSMGSLRVADHPGRDRYNYTWNVWLNDKPRPFVQTRRGINTFHVSATEEGLERLERAIRTRSRRIAQGLPRDPAVIEGRPVMLPAQ